MIHYDPVVTDDPIVAVMKEVLRGIVEEIHPNMAIHDLRVVPGSTHVNVVFDCVVPYDLKMENKEIKERIWRAVRAEYPNYYCVITLEHGYVHMA